MTKLHAQVLKLYNGALQGKVIAERYAQPEAIAVWNARIGAYQTVISLLGDPKTTPTKWKKFICNIFHQKHSLKCANCGGYL